VAQKSGKISQQHRLEAIRQKLLEDDEVSIEVLAGEFGVSGMTIRRDLDVLESEGDIIRTHGGAAAAKRLTFEFSFRDRQNRNIEQKSRIARLAIKYVRPGEVIMLDTGTTTLEIARRLGDKQKITVITTSLAIVSELQFAAGVETILLGGFLRKASPDLHGPLTEQNAGFFRSDVAFMGADAVDGSGNTYTDDLRVVTLDRKMAENAKKVIVVADSGKFAKTAMCRVLGPGDYDTLITDSAVDKKIAATLAKRKIKIEPA